MLGPCWQGAPTLLHGSSCDCPILGPGMFWESRLPAEGLGVSSVPTNTLPSASTSSSLGLWQGLNKPLRGTRKQHDVLISHQHSCGLLSTSDSTVIPIPGPPAAQTSFSSHAQNVSSRAPLRKFTVSLIQSCNALRKLRNHPVSTRYVYGHVQRPLPT